MTGRLAALRRPRASERARAHAAREQRLEAIRDAVEQFTYSLGLLIAGHDPAEITADDELAARLRVALRPFLTGGDVMRPDFGPFGDLRVEGELLQSREPVLAVLEFDDRCVRETDDGRLVPARLRRLRITMRVAVDPVSVVDCSVCEVQSRDA